MGEWGLTVTPRLESSPLWTLSPRALRLWIYLAMKANHAPVSMVIDADRIAVATGEWLTSTRKLKTALRTSSSAITADLKALRDAGVITMRAIPRTRFRNGGVPELGTPPTLATLVTVVGAVTYSAPRSQFQDVPDLGTKYKSTDEETPTSSALLSVKDKHERALAFAQLTAEGR